MTCDRKNHKWWEKLLEAHMVQETQADAWPEPTVGSKWQAFVDGKLWNSASGQTVFTVASWHKNGNVVMVDGGASEGRYFARGGSRRTYDKVLVEYRPYVDSTAAEPPSAAAGYPVNAKREVSHNGRDWTSYERLTDADPFESYTWQRFNGEITASPLLREALPTAMWAKHLRDEADVDMSMEIRRRNAAEKNAARVLPVTVDPRPVQSRLIDAGIGVWRTR